MKTFDPEVDHESRAALFACDVRVQTRYGSALGTREYSWSPKCGLRCGQG